MPIFVFYKREEPFTCNGLVPRRSSIAESPDSLIRSNLYRVRRKINGGPRNPGSGFKERKGIQEHCVNNNVVLGSLVPERDA